LPQPEEQEAEEEVRLPSIVLAAALALDDRVWEKAGTRRHEQAERKKEKPRVDRVVQGVAMFVRQKSSAAF
jgi:hypothetical protein